MIVATSASADEPLKLVELPSRPLGKGDIRVRVRAIGVNPVDWKMRSGGPLRMAHRFVGPSGPLVVGVDFAGEVVEVSPELVGHTDLAVGTRVVGGTDFSKKQLGSYATEVVVKPAQCAVLPDAMSFEDAACLPVPGVTALMSLVDLGGMSPHTGGNVLVLGASGGVGLFALQLARNLGATAVGVCSTRNVAIVTKYGASAIDYTTGDALAQAKDKAPFDVIVNSVGTDTYDGGVCRSLLKPKGKHVLAVVSAGDVPALAFSSRTEHVLGRVDRAHLDPLVAALARGELETLIEARLPLEQAEQAHTRSRSGKVVGKLLLIP